MGWAGVSTPPETVTGMLSFSVAKVDHDIAAKVNEVGQLSLVTMMMIVVICSQKWVFLHCSALGHRNEWKGQMCSIHCQHHNIGKIQFEYSQSFPSLMVWPRKTRENEWGKKGSKRGLAEWSVTTRLEPAPLTGWINAAAAFLAQVAFSPLSLAPPHLFQPRNSDIEQTAVGQSS